MKLFNISKKEHPTLKFLRQEPNLKDLKSIIDQMEAKQSVISYKYKDDILHIVNENAALYHIVNTTKKMEKLADASRENSKGVMLDIGGNIGLFSYFYKKKYPESKVYIFEADDELLPVINLNLKNFDSFEVHNLAISDIEGTVEFYSNPNSSQTNSTEYDAVSPFAKENEIVKKVIPSTTLINFCKNNSITEIQTLKIDIQGGEFKALKSSEEVIRITKEAFIEVCFLTNTTIPLLNLVNSYFNKYTPINEVYMGADLKFYN